MGRCRCCCSTCVAVVAVLFGLAWQQWPFVCCPHINVALPADAAADFCTSGKLPDLDTKGYVVIPQFLSVEETDSLLHLHRRLPPDPVANNGHNGGFKTPRVHGVVTWDATPGLLSRLLSLVQDIHRQTDIHLPTDPANISTEEVFLHTNASLERTVMFHWHQDHESFFIVQEHHHYLNFYMILEKPHATEAGLQVVPFDMLKATSPELHNLTKGSGATRFDVIDSGNRTILHSDTDDRSYVLNFDINRLACTPELRARDVLVLRGDVIHRTQPHRSARTSLTVRMHGRRPVDVSRLMQGGLEKYSFMSTAPAGYIRAAVHSARTSRAAGGGSWLNIGERPAYWFLRIHAGRIYRLVVGPFRLLLGSMMGEERYF